MQNQTVDVIDQSKRSTGLSDRGNERKITRRHGFGTRTEESQPIGGFSPVGKFGRMFPQLRPLIPSLESLAELGNAMKDDQTVDASGRPIPNPNGDNSNISAGFTYFGQFIDHDITLDTTALQELLVDPLALRNFRTPMLDLDCIYGSGPVAQPYLYQRSDNDLFLIGKTSINPGVGDPNVTGELPHDLPRNIEGFALIGDPRNDENLVVAQTQLAFLKFHNKVVEGLKNGSIVRESPIRKSTFEEARDTVIWHYQWIVINDFLTRLLDTNELNDVLNNGRRFYNTSNGEPFIPVEFSAGAYRFGHTMVREAYNYNRVFRFGGFTPATLSLLFRFSGLSGTSVPIPSDWIIDWRRFFNIDPNITPELSRSLDPFLIPQLHNLPGVPSPSSLAVRNLQRGRSLGLPPGQSIARFMGFTPLSPSEISQGPDGAVAAQHNFHIESPLWYYILKEAQVLGNGQRLGQVGSRIIAEVFIGLLQSDSSSFMVRKPNWKPTLPSQSPGTFTMVDLLNFVGEINPIGD